MSGLGLGIATAHLKAHADAHPVRMKSFTSGLSDGVADSLDEAKAAFRGGGGAAVGHRFAGNRS